MNKLRFLMTENALDNYGSKYFGVILEVTHKATKYMPAKEFYAKNRPQGYHPGYDLGLSPMPLYDLKRVDTDEDLPFSLYKYELEQI